MVDQNQITRFDPDKWTNKPCKDYIAKLRISGKLNFEFVGFESWTIERQRDREMLSKYGEQKIVKI